MWYCFHHMAKTEKPAREDVVLHLRLPADVYERLKDISVTEDRTITAVARRVMQGGLQAIADIAAYKSPRVPRR